MSRVMKLTGGFVRVVTACALAMMAAGVSPALAQITISIENPQVDQVSGDPLPVNAFIASTFELTSVQATVGSQTIPLTLSGGRWVGAVPLTGLARGPQQLTISASNSNGQTAQAQRRFVLDRLPVLTVTAPGDYAFGQPDIRVVASCTDDGPACTVQVRTDFFGEFAPAASAPGSIDTYVSPPEGETSLEIAAVDSTGRATAVVRKVFVQSSTRLHSVSQFTGRLLDVDATRALVYDDLLSPRTLRIVARATNASETIWTGANSFDNIMQAHLTPLGALFSAHRQVGVNNDIEWRLFEWRGGPLVDLDLVSPSSLTVKGPWAVFTSYAPTCCLTSVLVRRDLMTGTNVSVSSIAGNVDNDVKPDGRVVFWAKSTPNPTPYEICEFDPGPPETTTPLTAAFPMSSVYPDTDGTLVVFTRLGDFVSSPASIVLRLADGTEEVLATGLFHPTPAGRPPSVPGAYQVTDGWVAFIRPGNGGSTQACVRAPDGTRRQLSSTGGATEIESVSETGEVLFRVSVSGQATRYLAEPDGSTIELGKAIGSPVRIGDAWFLMVGANLLAIVDTPARSLLSEGATGSFFTTDVAILNPHATEVQAHIRFLREGQAEITDDRTLAARSRTTLHLNTIPGLEGTAVSTVVESPAGSPLVVERLMTWDPTGYGGHLATAVDRARPHWLFAEGSQGFFSTFFLIANSEASDATVRFTFLVEQGTPVTHTVTVPAGTRKTVFAGDVPALVNTSFSTAIDSSVPIVAERAMYFGDSPLWYGGHGTAGVPGGAAQWFLAEAATGSFFDTFILIGNPTTTEVLLVLFYATEGGQQITKTHTLPPLSRLTINLEDEDPAHASASASVRIFQLGPPGGVPIVVERAMYWGPAGMGWREAHDSFGVTGTAVKWGLAEGRVGGPRAYQTYVLVSNANSSAAEIKVTFLRETGTPVERTYTVAANQRFTINTADIADLANSNFATIIESTSGQAINVESSIYWNVNGTIWEGGGNTTATPLQ